MMKYCGRCKETKESSEFHKNSARPDGLQAQCKKCFAIRNKQYYNDHPEWHQEKARRYAKENRETINAYRKKWLKQNPEAYARAKASITRCHRKRRYGITDLKFQEMVVLAKGLCEACRHPDSRGMSLSVDHNHVTGKVRGLLCNDCNRALGFSGDNEEILFGLIRYLQRCKKKEVEQKSLKRM